MTCAKCGLTRTTKSDRVPSGWKRQDEIIFCQACWRERYILRAVTIPVASPLDRNWDDFGRLLRDQWGTVTRASNWMLTEMYARDDRTREAGKLQPMPKVYLYPETRRLFPALPSPTCAALEQAVGKKYRARRYEVVWTCAASLPTYRYPTPLPIPNQGWSVEMENGCPIVSARIGEERMKFRLRGGHQFRRQLAAVQQMVAGTAQKGQLDLFRKGKSVMCKMVAWLPRQAGEKPDGTLFVRTSADALLVAVNQKDEALWTYHGDQARRWAAEHGRQLQRWADDSKAEHRPVPPFARRRTAATLKYRDRMRSLTQQVAIMVVEYAKRRKFGIIEYDDSDRSFLPQFPWFELRSKISDKSNQEGIELRHIIIASGEAQAELREPLA